jgi:hypothetical protein
MLEININECLLEKDYQLLPKAQTTRHRILEL